MDNKVNQNLIGLNLDAITWQVKENQITWALNANIQSHDGDSLTYTNEPANTPCYSFTEGQLAGFKVVGFTNIVEQSKVILFLTHPDGRSRIGQITSIGDACLDITLTERDCGCKEGTVITEAVVSENFPNVETVPACPDGYYLDETEGLCKRLLYAEPQIIKETYLLTSTSNSAFGFMQPVLYDEGWNSRGWGGTGALNSGITRLTAAWWRYNGTPGNAGRINEIAVQISTGSVLNTWLSFTTTLCVEEEKVYYFAIAADNAFRVKLDEDIILDPTLSALIDTPGVDSQWRINVFGSAGATNAERISYGMLHIYPLRLTKGNHIFQIEYVDYGNPQMVAAEIYDNTFAEIVAATSINDLDIIWSTDDQTQVESIISATCPDGYILSADENCALSCVLKLEQTPVYIEQTPTCCKYEDLVVDDCLDICPDSCYEYVLGFVSNTTTVIIDGVPVLIPDPVAATEKTFTYTDCQGNEVSDFILTDNKRFTARKGSLVLNHNRLVIFQETKVIDPGTANFSKDNCCLNFDIAFPINAEYRIDECETKIYYISRNNPPRYFSTLFPYGKDACGNNRTCIKDSCEDSKLFPDFCIPDLHAVSVNSNGQLKAGVYSFAIAYADEQGIELTDYSDLTNPIPIFERTITEQTEYVTSSSISVEVHHKTRIFEYFNIVVAETVNTVTNYHLIGTYRVNQYTDKDTLVYTGDYKSTFSSIVPLIRSPHYETANIIEKQNDILMLADLEEYPKFNFQPFASKLKLYWETVEMPADGQFDYSSPEVAYFFRTYQRDEVYPFGIKFRLKNGKYTDVFHIPGRTPVSNDLQLEASDTNPDVFVAESDCLIPDQTPRWKVYNTASPATSIVYDKDAASDIEKQYNCAITNHQTGQFAYWESTDVYPCYDEVWGQSTDPNAPYYDPDALGGRPIRHHKFPDSSLVHIHGNGLSSGNTFDTQINNDSKSKLYPIGVRIDESLMTLLLNQKNPNGTYKFTVYDPIQKKNIPVKDVVCGYELVRGNRVGNKSVIAKGLIYDVGTFEDNSGDGPIKKYYYSNYPYNDLRQDPYLMNDSRWYNEDEDVLEGDNSTTVGGVGGFATYSFRGGNDRFTFYSPDTSFQYPKIGTELKLETLEFGKVLGHFVPVAEHPRYRFLKERAFFDAGALASLISFEQNSENEADVSLTGGTRTRTAFNVRFDQLFTNEQLFLDITEKLIPFVNFAYQYNSIANYNQFIPISPTTNTNHYGNSRRFIDLGYYANERIVQVFDDAPLHNRLRETSVYLKLKQILPNLESQILDNSRYLSSSHGPGSIDTLKEITTTRAYYASIKRQFPNQYGIIENLKYVSTGYKQDIILDNDGQAKLEFKYYPAFGGDTFITPFALKRKHSFFTRNLVNLPAKIDEVPFDYWLFPNMAYPKYFIGTSSNINSLDAGDMAALIAGILGSIGVSYGLVGTGGLLGVGNYVTQIITNYLFMNGIAPLYDAGVNAVWSKFVKKTSLDGEKGLRYHKDGIFYTASYGIPIFFVESDVNTHFRHGRDLDKENFYPNVGGGVPDEWLQEATVPIKFDNFYHYNATYSMQNMSPNFPYRLKYPNLECIINHQNRVIYSDQASDSNLTSDKWLAFRPGNFYDFPKQGGRLIDLNAGESERVYARFENTTKVYNARIVLSSTSPYQLEIGNADMFKQKPVDLSATDLGYIGSQHKAYVRCEYGTFWVDAKRGHVYQITGQGFNEVKNELNYNWFKENLPFQILKDFPDVDTDVPSLGLGIIMGWDERYERVFITKLDYRVRPAYKNGPVKIEYITDRLDVNYRYFVLNNNGTITRVDLSNKLYFENKSWTVAYSPKLKNFISFYSFLPNFFIPQLGHFQTIITTPAGSSLWNHNLSPYLYQTYYGKLYPYIIEYLITSLPINSIVTSVSLVADIQEYYSKYEYYSLATANNKNTANFTKAIVYNREQSSGIINLVPEIFGNTKQKVLYPRMTTLGIETLLSRRENKFTFNGFWNIAAQANGQPLWSTKWEDLQNDYFIDKMPNTKAIRNLSVAYQKNKIKADFTKIRLIQDKYNRYKFVNNIQITQINNTTL